MNKQFILNAFNRAIESTKLWHEFSMGIDNLFGFDGLYDSKYIESLQFHQELVWDLIKIYRGYEEIDQQEFDVFIETLWDLAAGHTFGYTDENGNKVVLTDREQILDLFLAPNFIIRVIIATDPDFFN